MAHHRALGTVEGGHARTPKQHLNAARRCGVLEARRDDRNSRNPARRLVLDLDHTSSAGPTDGATIFGLLGGSRQRCLSRLAIERAARLFYRGAGFRASLRNRSLRPSGGNRTALSASL